MKERIAFVVNSLSGGGAERTVSNLSMALSECYDIDIIVNDREHLAYPYRGNIWSLGMPLPQEATNAAYQLLVVARRTLLLCQLKKKRRYIAVISFSEMCNAANVLSGSRYTRTVISVRNAVNKGNSGIKRILVQKQVMPYICKGADRTVSCSREIADELMRDYDLQTDRSFVIYNGLDLERIRMQASAPISEEEEAAFAGKNLIVSIGRLTAQKGQFHLLRVVDALRRNGFPVHLLLLGEGELRPELEKAVAGMGLSDCVSMPGFVRNPYQYLARADVFVLPSLYEGFSNAILEAMACGVPVISTDHETGAREILAPDTDYRMKTTDSIDEAAYGILVPVCSGAGSAEAEIRRAKELSKEEALMAEAIKRVLSDEELADHYRKASDRRADQLDLASVCRQWIDVIATKGPKTSEGGTGWTSWC